MENIYRDRVVKVQTNGVEVTNEVLHIEAEVPFDDDSTPNVSTIRIYNLSEATASRFEKGKQLTLLAGYQNDVGIILQGQIIHRRIDRVGTDKPLILRVMDGNGAGYRMENKEVELSYKAATRSSTIIRDLANKIGLKLKELSLPNDKVQKKGYTANGGAIDSIRRLAEDCGASFYYVLGAAYIRDIRVGDNTHFTLSAETGLIGSPELSSRTYQKKEFTDVLSITSLLQHVVTTASILTLQSRNFSGKYRVISGEHIIGKDHFTRFEVIANGTK